MTTKTDLLAQVHFLNRLTDNKYDFSVGYAYGKPRLYRNDNSREVSPRLPKDQLADWIGAFIYGIEVGRDRIYGIEVGRDREATR